MRWDEPVDKAPVEREVAPHKAKKDTRRWCRGKKGVEHQPEIVLDKYVMSLRRFSPEPLVRMQCRWTLWFVRGRPVDARPHYSCSHQRRCINCGKIVDFRVQAKDCPDYVEGPKGPVSDLRCECGCKLDEHRAHTSACSNCVCQRFRWVGVKS